MKKTLYPRRCDLSADGQLLLYYLAGGLGYRVYCGISRVPWLHPLVDWSDVELGTWGAGWHFYEPGIEYGRNEPDQFTVGNTQVSVRPNWGGGSFVNERRRGWVAAPDSPPRTDQWDANNTEILQKTSAENTLRLLGGLCNFSPPAIEGMAPRYELNSGRNTALLEDVCWADWSPVGHLLTATSTGQLRMEEFRAGERKLVVTHDLSTLKPDPQPPPVWAMNAPEHPLT